MSEQDLLSQILKLQQRLQKLETQEGGGGGSIAADTVAYFVGAAAPTGWVEYTSARGRMIVGLPIAGTLEGTVGTALTDLQDKAHTHTGPSHTHTGPSHSHSLNQDGTYTHGIATVIVTGSNGSDGTLYTASGSGTSGGLQSTTNNQGTGVSGAGGTGATGTSAASAGIAWIQLLAIRKT